MLISPHNLQKLKEFAEQEGFPPLTPRGQPLQDICNMLMYVHVCVLNTGYCPTILKYSLKKYIKLGFVHT